MPRTCLLALLIACSPWLAPVQAAVPTQPSWAKNPGAPAEEDPTHLKGRYYCYLVVGGSLEIKMWYVEASRTVSQRNPFPMGAHTNAKMAHYPEMHRPADFRTYPFDAGQWSEGYGVQFEHDLWVAEHEVSMELWDAVMGARPANWPDPSTFSDTNSDGLDDDTGFINFTTNKYSYAPSRNYDGANPDRSIRTDPVVFVTWYEAKRFITNLDAMLPSLGTHEVALPTEAEWQFVARAIDAPDAGDDWPLMIDEWTWGGVGTEPGSHPGDVVSDWPNLEAGVNGGLVIEGESYDPGSNADGDGWLDVGGDPADPFHGVRNLSHRNSFRCRWINDDRHRLYDGDAGRWEARWPGDDNPNVPGNNVTKYRVTFITPLASRPPTELDLEIQRSIVRHYNPFGLRHVGGNVAEWCEDHWDGSSPYNTLGASVNLAAAVGDAAIAARMPTIHGSVSDPADGHTANTNANHELRITRGGSWLNGGRECRPSSRAGMRPDDFNDQVGFRFLIRATP